MTTAGGNTQRDASKLHLAGISPWARIVAGTTLFSVFAISGNALNIDLFFGVNFLFGTVFVWLCLALLGPIPATITATLSAGYTVFLWGHYYAFLVFFLEFAFILAARGARNPSNVALLLVLYWLLIGAPLSYCCYKFGLSLPNTTVNIVVAKQVLNSLVNACIAILIYNLLVGLRLPGEAIDRLIRHRKLSDPSYAGVAQALIALVVLIPVGVTEILSIRKAFDSRIASVVHTTTSIASRLQDHALPNLEMETKLWSEYFQGQELPSARRGNKNLEYVTNDLGPESIFRVNPDGSHKLLAGIPQVTENDEILPGLAAGTLFNTPSDFNILGCHAGGIVTSLRESTLGSVLVLLWPPSNMAYLTPDDGATEITCPSDQFLNTRFSNAEPGATKIVRSLDKDLPALVSWLGSSIVTLESLKSDGPIISIETKLRSLIQEFQREYSFVILRFTGIGVVVIVLGRLFSQMLHGWLNRYAKETEYFVRSGKVSKRALLARFLEDKRAVEWVRKVELIHREKEKKQFLARRNFDDLVHTSSAPIFATDKNGCVHVWNDTMVELTGFRLNDVVGRPISELVIRHTNDKYHPFPKELLSNTAEAFEFSMRTRDGGNIFLLGGGTIIQDLSTAVAEVKTESQRNDAQLNYFTAQDLTATKSAQDQLLHAARLTALGEMASTFAHELNQPLNAISLAAGNGRVHLSLGEKGLEKASEKFNRIEDQAIRAGEIIRTIRGFVLGRTVDESVEFDAINAVKACVDLLAEQLRVSSTTIELGFSNTPVILKGQILLFEQGIIAILTNAMQALASTPAEQRNIKVWIEKEDCLTCAHSCAISCARHKRDASPELPESIIKLMIEDNGGGIPESVIDRVFDPFVSTKSKQEGTGIGLYLARSAFEAIGGRIHTGNTSMGAKFEICFPVNIVCQETLAGRGDK